MKTSMHGINLIKQFEGVRLQAYKPLQSEKYWTIGFGHYGADVSANMVITQEQAEALLVKDLEKFETAVNKYVERYHFTQGQFDALVSFAFNCGVGNLNKLVDNGNRNLSKIAACLTQYNKAGGKVLQGLVRRRAAELNLFNSDIKTTSDNVDVKIDTNNITTNKIANCKYKITANNLRIRSGCGTDYIVVGSVKKDDIVDIQNIIGTKDQIWGKLADNKYICIKYDDNTYYAVKYTPVNVKKYSLKVDGNKELSKNFKVKEFKCKDGSDEILIDDKLISYLQQIRDYFNKPVIINSGYRTQEHNRRVGGALNSYHKQGRAADISISGVTTRDIASFAEFIGCLGIGLYDNFVHIDSRDNKYFWYGSNQIKQDTFINK